MTSFAKIKLGVSRALTNTAISNNDLTNIKQCYNERDCCAFVNRLERNDVIFLAVKSKNAKHKKLIQEYKPYVDSILDRLGLDYETYEGIDMSDVNEYLKVSGDYVYSFKATRGEYLDLFYFTIIRFLNDLKIEILNYCKHLESLGFDVLQALAYANMIHAILDDNFDATFSLANSYFYDFKTLEEFKKTDKYNIAGPQRYAYKYNYWSNIFYVTLSKLLISKKDTETFMDVYLKYKEFLKAKSITFHGGKLIKVELSDSLSNVSSETIKSVEPKNYSNLFKNSDSTRITITQTVKSYE